MKVIRLSIAAVFLFNIFITAQPVSDYFVREQIRFDPNNIGTWIWNSGVFDQDMRTNNTPGFQWPKGTGKFAIFTAGLCIGAYVNSQLRLANASYIGEYAPGYVADSSSVPVGRSDTRFKFYTVKRYDNWSNNSDWLNWGLMVPYGAPYIDVNNNGNYEPVIDTPGIRGAVQTIFICLTDAFPENHSISEGFAGGTLPLYAEVHLTAWGYDNPGYQDIQFFRWEVINKNNYSWDSTYFSIVSDPDLGEATDDYIGCDTNRRLGYVYNADNMDGSGTGVSYGANPPAAGFIFLKGAVRTNIVPYLSLGLTAFDHFLSVGAGAPVCEGDPQQIIHAYNYMKGMKRDGTPWLCPVFSPPKRTKFIYSGDPETNTGWNEYQGKIGNCGGDTAGIPQIPSPAGDRRLIMTSGAPNLFINPGDTQTIIAAQLIARGSNHKNSVTLLKQLADVAIQLYNSGFVIGVEPISTEIPNSLKLCQNYPNPFNPVTKIKFGIPSAPLSFGEGPGVRLVVYDILGREIKILTNEVLKAGTYETEWDASNYPSGVYFYKLMTEDFTETKKMVLIK